MNSELVRLCLHHLIFTLFDDGSADWQTVMPKDAEDEGHTSLKAHAQIVEICLPLLSGMGVTLVMQRDDPNKRWLLDKVCGDTPSHFDHAVRFQLHPTSQRNKAMAEDWAERLEKLMLKHDSRWHQRKE